VLLSPLITVVFLPFVAFTIAYYVLSMVVTAGTRGFDQEAHRALVTGWRPPGYPSLDVFLPVCGEPIEVLHNTWVHVFELIQAYPGIAAAYVLDDGASGAAQAMAASFGFRYLVRPDRGQLRKAGNLRHGFAHSAGEFILLLDADFAPRPDMPAELLPYFSADPALGIVQSPQFFRTSGRMSWTERGASAVQELFYRLIQVSLDRHDGAICVGTCGLYRRAALAVNGGTTPIEHSEDIHTGFDLQRAGWGLRYVPVPLATGLCPSDPDSFLTQQYRWCAGSMSLIGSRKFWTARMRLRTRCGYLAGFCYYVHTALFTFVAPAISLLLLVFLPQRVALANYGFIVPGSARRHSWPSCCTAGRTCSPCGTSPGAGRWPGSPRAAGSARPGPAGSGLALPPGTGPRRWPGSGSPPGGWPGTGPRSRRCWCWASSPA
jgi:cellulose synthase (UDP-forming)